MARCQNMVGQSTKTFPSPQSSRLDPGGRLVDGSGGKNCISLPGPFNPSPEDVLRERGGGLSVLVVVSARGLLVPSPPPAVTCTEFSCHSALTFHLLGTEQKRCWDFFFFLERWWASFSENKQKKKKLTTVVKNSPKRAPDPRHSVNRCRNLILCFP